MKQTSITHLRSYMCLEKGSMLRGVSASLSSSFDIDAEKGGLREDERTAPSLKRVLLHLTSLLDEWSLTTTPNISLRSKPPSIFCNNFKNTFIFYPVRLVGCWDFHTYTNILRHTAPPSLGLPVADPRY